MSYNLEVVRDWKATEWKKWLFAALGTPPKTKPLRIPAQAEVVEALEDLFAEATTDVREALKEGIVKAIREWVSDESHGYAVLTDLAWAAAMVRATDVIPHLKDFLLRHRHELADGESDFFDVADDIVSTLTGFAPDAHVARLFSILLYDDDVTPRLAALLALGIFITDESRFTECFERFALRRQEEPEYFKDRDIVWKFAKRIDPRELVPLARKQRRAVVQNYLLLTAVDLGLVPPGAAIDLRPPHEPPLTAETLGDEEMLLNPDEAYEAAKGSVLAGWREFKSRRPELAMDAPLATAVLFDIATDMERQRVGTSP
jgi:hypothetical protein